MDRRSFTGVENTGRGWTYRIYGVHGAFKWTKLESGSGAQQQKEMLLEAVGVVGTDHGECVG